MYNLYVRIKNYTNKKYSMSITYLFVNAFSRTKKYEKLV